MTDIRIKKYAQTLINYSLEVEKGNLVVIQAYPMAYPLIEACYEEVIKAGAHPHVILKHDLSEILLKEGSEEQLTYVSPISEEMVKKAHRLLSIGGGYNTKLKKFILGFEESYGYLVGDHARDKDAIGTSLLLSEMALFYKENNKSFGDVLEEIYQTYGYYMDEIESIKLEGKEGSEKLQKIAAYFRKDLQLEWAGLKVKVIEDYLYEKRTTIGEGCEKLILPKSNVIKVYLEEGSWFSIRPSGTEPKIKIYFSVRGETLKEAKAKLDVIKMEVMEKALQIQD